LRHNRVNVIAPTQDGKSLTIASAVTCVAALRPEKFTILAPSEKKADIVMAYIRDFATQHPLIYTQLELDKNEVLDRLKRERSRRHLTFKKGGGVQTLTLDARNSKRCIEAAMGFGSKNIIQDEASLIGDNLHSTVMRMLGGYKYSESFLLKIGNPFYRNHFYRSANDAKYKQIYHNYKHSLADNKAGYHGFDKEFIEEMKNEAFFDVYYDCLFPPEDKIDERGFRQLVVSSDLHFKEVKPVGEPMLGADIGGGGDYNVYVVRWDNLAKITAYNKSNDTMVNVSEIERIIKKYNIKPENVNIDDIGVGRGVVDRLKEKKLRVNGVSVGAKSKQIKYANLKAELYWLCSIWLKDNYLEDFKINYTSVWQQLTWIKYKVNSDKQIGIEPKADLKKRTAKSPDFADAFMLTFYKKPTAGIIKF